MTSRSVAAQYAQLVISCTVLGLGVALLLEAGMGSDGYSTLVSGLTIQTGTPFWLMNIMVGAVFVAIAWARGRKPGPGTLVQWFLVGTVISVGMALVPDLEPLVVRVTALVLALVLMSFGVAGYLASNTGAGPAEAMALAWDPPLPFRWSYSILQAVGALAGWLMGASVGPGTVLIFILMGPAVDLIRRRWTFLEFPARRAADSE
ncbi:YczE/YyaS/YitT family protein [Tessaracoccus antarcticus]|uniref:YczE/YyaS/YitT family protein n=1 Tax=Tessaracoccus antarcticus TaxID=2479848 RepID=UPI0011C40F29|nr:hypothetical protein [Tessaracoccus antarcticus]